MVTPTLNLKKKLKMRNVFTSLLILIISVFSHNLFGMCDAINGGAVHCAEEVITYSVNGGCGGSATYVWSITAQTGTTASIPGSTSSSTCDVDMGAGSGTFTLQVVVDGGTPITLDVTVNGLPLVTAGGPYSAVCEDAPDVTLTGTPTGGTWSGTGVTDGSGGSGTFDPSGLSGSIALTYSFTNASGCTNSATQNITVNPLPIVSAGGPYAAVCENAPDVTLTGTPSGGTWSGTGVTDGSGSSGTFDPSGLNGPVTLTYSFTSVSGCTNTATSSITVDPVPTASISGTGSVCLNSSPAPLITFTGAGGSTPYTFTYKVNGGADQTISTTSGSSVTLVHPTNVAGTFTYSLVSVIDNKSCEQTQSGSAVITINPLPDLVIGGSSSFCTGSTTTLIAQNSVGSTPGDWTFLWAPGGQETSSIEVGTATTYSVVVTDGNGCTSEESITVTENPNLSINITGDLELCGSETTTLCAPSGSGYNYQWSNSTTNMCINNVVAGTYSVTVTDTNVGCTGEATVTVLGYDRPTASLSASILEYCTETTPPNITITLTGEQPYNLVYTRDGANDNNVNGLNSNTYIITEAIAGTYVVSTLSDKNCVALLSPVSNDLTIVENPLPTVAISPANPAFCPGTSANVSIVGTFTSVTWRKGTTIIGSGNDIDINVEGNDYSVTVVDGNSCENSLNFSVLEQSEVIVNISGEPFFCPGGNTVLDAGNYSEYLWSPGGQTTKTIAVSTAGTYTVQVVDANGCTGSNAIVVTQLPSPTVSSPVTDTNLDYCTSDPTPNVVFTLDGTGIQSAKYKFNNGVAQNAPLSGNQVVIVNGAAGEYKITEIVDMNCTTISTFESPSINLIANSVPNFSIETSNNNSTILCEGEVMDLSTTIANPNNYIFTWTFPNGSTASTSTITINEGGVYSCVLTDEITGCSATRSVTITISVVSATINTNTGINAVCIGESITLLAQGGNEIEWAAPISGADKNKFTIQVSPTTETTYTAKITSQLGCEKDFSITIGVNPLPTPNIIADQNTYCEGSQVTLTTDESYVVYDWSTGGNSTAVSFEADPDFEDFSVIVTDINNCSADDEITLDVKERPYGEIVTPTVSAFTLEEITFTVDNVSSDNSCSVSSYDWYVDDVLIQTTTDPEFKYIFNSENSFIVSVVVEDNCGCRSNPDNVIMEISLNGSCSVTINEVPKFCLGQKVILKANPKPGSLPGTNIPKEGYFNIEGVKIRPSEITIDQEITANGKKFTINKIESIDETNFNDRIEVTFGEAKNYTYSYFIDYTGCLKTTTNRTASVKQLPFFDNVIIDDEACFGESPKVIFELGITEKLRLNYEEDGVSKTKVFGSGSSNFIQFNNLTNPNNDIDVNLTSLTLLLENDALGCSNENLEPNSFSINVLEQLTVNAADTCDTALENIQYTLELAGGTGMYSINGVDLMGANTFVSEFFPSGNNVNFTIVDENCDEANSILLDFNNSCENCINLQDTIDNKGIVVSGNQIVCEDELVSFTISELPQISALQTLVYAIQKEPSQFYDPANIIIDSIPSDQKVFNFSFASNSQFEYQTKYYLTIYVFSKQATGFKSDATCAGLVNRELVFYQSPASEIIQLEDNTVCQNEIDFQLGINNNVSKSTWSSPNSNVSIKYTEGDDRALVNFGTISGTTVDINLLQENIYAQAGNLSCSDEDVITLNVLEKIAPPKDSIIWWPGDYLAYTGLDMCYQWYINDLIIPGETDRFYIHGKPIESDIISVDVYDCTDSALECVTTVYYNALEPPKLTYNPTADIEYKLFPNPNQGVFTMELDGEQGGLFLANIYDATGQPIKSQKIIKESTNHKEIIDLSFTANGLYFIQIIDEGGERSILKFVKD